MPILIKSGSSFKSSLSFKITRIEDIPNLEGWWKAGVNIYKSISPLTPAASGDSIYRWTDTTANARNFDQSTLSNRPTLIDNAINGLPIVRMATSTAQNKFLDNTTLPASDGTSGITLFIVALYSGTYPATSNSAGGLSYFGNRMRYPNSSNNIEDITGSNTSAVFTPTLAINQWRVISSRSKTNLKTYYLNKTQQYTSTTNSFLMNTTKRIGNNNIDAFVGDLGDVLYFSRYLTDIENDAVISVLMTKFGLT